MSTVQHFARPPSCLSYMASLSISEAVGKIMGGPWSFDNKVKKLLAT